MTNDKRSMSRRGVCRQLAAWMAASPLAAQLDLPYAGERVPAMEELVNVFEFEPICKLRIPRQNYDYIAGGVDNEWSLRRNREAFDKITFRPRMLVNASNLDLSLDLLGTRMSCPIMIAPTAGHNLATADGELATAKAAADTETILILSTNSSQPYEKVAESTNFPKWFQLYPGPDLETTWERVDRVKAAGYKVMVLTVDAGYNSHRERLLRNQVRAQVPAGVRSPQTERRRRTREDEAPAAPPRPAVYGLSTTLMHQLDWSFAEQLKKRFGGPVVIKGILTGEDGALAVKHGMDGVIVSNHGGRYLEYAPATIDVLPEVVEQVGGKIPVLVDSGFRRGTDILKALALGAKAVCVGRPPLWGLGAFGADGCKRVMELMRTELALAMGLCGKATLKDIDKRVIHM